MIRRVLAAATAATAAVAAVLLATPALAVERAPAQTGVDATARVCAALTVDGVELLRAQPTLAGLLRALPVPTTNVTPAQIADARSKLGCGPAPTGRGDATLAADVCAALNIDDANAILGRLNLTAQAQAVVDAARPVAPQFVSSLRRDLNCSTPVSPPATDTPTTGPAPSTGPDSSSNGGSGSGGSTGNVDGTVPVPSGAPETGA